MINVNNLSIHFAGNYLFDNVSFTINPKDRIGLIGRNGTGKSTLIKLITGLEQAEEGNISKPNSVTLGYLPQEGMLNSDKNIYDEAKDALDEIKYLSENIKKLTEELGSREDYESNEYEKLVSKLSEANDRYNILGGHSIDAEIEKILIGLGFKREDFGKLVKEFSGGWQMRIELAKILLRRPDCIFLDEPTNHLDIESIMWVENFLKSYHGAVVLVSHDRNFLNAVTNRTIEISNAKTYDMNLPYSEFVEQRKEQKKQQLAAYNNQQKQIAQTERFIERFRYKSALATRVQSKIKQLEKVERIEVEEEEVLAIKLTFPEPPRSGRLVAECRELSKRYGENLVLDKIELAIERNERVAFVGKNGEGKSTLTKIIAGLEDFEGALEIGHNTQIGYFAQHQAELLDPDDTVFDVIDKAAVGEMRTQIRKLLGAFLFSGETVNKKVKVLSGGEKSRLAIAKMLLKPINLLILDEPTNHLDMLAKDVLKNALKEFRGALLVVSHDRSFLHGLTDKTVHFSDTKIKEYPGDIYEFLEKQQIESLKQLEMEKKEKSGKNESLPPSRAQLDREAKKTFQREQNKLKKLISSCEEGIENLELEIAELEAEFANPDFFADPEKSKLKQQLFNELKEKLEAKMDEWSILEENLDQLENDL